MSGSIIFAIIKTKTVMQCFKDKLFPYFGIKEKAVAIAPAEAIFNVDELMQKLQEKVDGGEEVTELEKQWKNIEKIIKNSYIFLNFRYLQEKCATMWYKNS